MRKVWKVENGILYEGTQEPLPRKNGGNCPFCGKPVWVSSGQALKHLFGNPTHKQCRKNAKHKTKHR